MRRVAVIGASGFIGRHLIPQLVTAGYEVRALIQYVSEVPPWHSSVTVVRGDVRSLGSVRSAVENCEVLVHLAASRAPKDAEETIIRGTEMVIAAAREAGVERLISLSCLGADAASHSGYYAAKWRSETLIRDSGLTWTILRPSLVLGKDDGIIRPLAALIRSLPLVPIPGRGDHRQQPIDVDDLSRCILESLTREDVKNESISVGGSAFVTYRQLVDLIAGHLGVLKPKLLIPPQWLGAAAPWMPQGASSLFAPSRLDQFEHSVVASPGIVQRRFEFEPRSIIDSLPDYLA